MTQPVDLHEAAVSGKRYDLTFRSGQVYRKQKVVIDKYDNVCYPDHRYWVSGFSYTRYGAFLADRLESDNDIVKMELSEEVPERDPINPDHYRSHPSGVECIQITEHFPFNRGNAIKYIWRAGSKGCPIEDLRKAAWYIEREIQRLQNS